MSVKITFSLVFMFSLIGGQGQEKLYQSAYNYIKVHPDTQHFYWENSIPYQECIKVSSEIVPLSVVPFFDEFNSDSTSTKKSLEVIDSLEMLDKRNYFEPYRDEALSRLSSCDEDSQSILFFSKISDENTLLAMLFVGKYSSKDFDELTRFNEGLLFLLYTEEGSNEITGSLSNKVRFE